MVERRALLIGAQNDRFGRLDFVPEVIRHLHAVVLDRRYGACQPALPDGRELLTGPAATRVAVETALDDAMARAGREQATLFVYFLGHATRRTRTSISSPPTPPRPELIGSKNAVSLGQQIKELLRRYPGVDGLMLVNRRLPFRCRDRTGLRKSGARSSANKHPGGDCPLGRWPSVPQVRGAEQADPEAGA